MKPDIRKILERKLKKLRRDIMSPSLMCCDMMHMERDIRALERGGVDMLHIDIMDTTFTTSTMLPPYMLKQLVKCTSLPLDIHLMSKTPELYLEQILPYCKGGCLSVHVEGIHTLPYVISKIRKAGVHPAIALNGCTPLAYVEELAPIIDMVLLINRVAGITGPRSEIDEVFASRIGRTRMILDHAGREDAWLGVDGNVSIQNARTARKHGANVYVLGTASVFKADISIEDACTDFRREILEGENE